MAVSAGTCNRPAGDQNAGTKVSPTPVEVSAKASRAAKKTQRVDAKASSRTRALDAAKDEIAVKKAAKVSSS